MNDDKRALLGVALCGVERQGREGCAPASPVGPALVAACGPATRTAERLQVTRVELLAERGCEVSYSSLRRFIQRRGWRQRQPVTVRMEDGPPGEVAEMDFGRLGYLRDPESGRRRTVWALIVVWRYSRHCFVWPTTSQRLDAVVEGLEAAWACFEGVPRYLVSR